MKAQSPVPFEAKMKNHVQSFLMDNEKVEKWKKENTIPFIKMDPTENEDLLNRLVIELKHQFIIDNMDEYKRAYFPEEYTKEYSAMMITDTFICDNGGFESDFLYYKGYRSIFDLGSTTCTPTYDGNPSVYTQATLPATREFEIVTSGIDAVTGLQKVKFGNKALKLNDVYHHSNGGCTGGLSINKLVKRFKVTEENRDFTVWYSIALENPAGHDDTQPFFNIKCDLAPYYDLCFDAALLDCDSLYEQSGCINQLMDVLDWSCHRIKIPPTEIGNIATLEIVMADCGWNGHNGYAYIDGICEPCTGSALGSVTLDDPCYNSCDSETAMLCGHFTYPTLCGEWTLDSLVFPGIGLEELVVDDVTGVFCFNLPISSFGEEECLSFFVEAYFSSSLITLPVQISNTIEICQEHYVDSNLDSLISYISRYDSICNGCFNDTLGYVTLFDEVVDGGLGILYRSCDGDIARICGDIKYPLLCDGWELDSLIICGVEVENMSFAGYNGNFCFDVPLESFGEEDCLNIVAKAYFSLDTILLPVLMSDTIEICKEFYDGYDFDILIGDCHNNNTTTLLSDDYYFIKVTLSNVLGANWIMKRRLDYPYIGEGGLHLITSGSGDTVIFLGPFLIQEGGWDLIIDLPGCIIVEHITPPVCNTTCVFGGYRIIGVECIDGTPDKWEFTLIVPGTSGGYTYTSSVSNGVGTFGVPNKIENLPLTPECITISLISSDPSCVSRIIVCPPKPCGEGLNCDLEVYVAEVICNENGEYSYILDVKTSQMGKIICYETVDAYGINMSNNTGPSSSPPSGPFDGDTQLIVRLCDGTDCSECDDECFKVLYIPQPDCPAWEDNKTDLRTLQKTFKDEVKVYPNPFTNDEFTIVSALPKTSIQIFTLGGVLIAKGNFEGKEHIVSLQSSAGMYILKYKDSHGLTQRIKIVKM